ncbi:MAG: ACT domain-containing protein [Clostridiaceae bacterium]|nr:ACT domain-containing protein [Clostridiales bacterium]MDD6876872.1 ACT domain-containing protein [Clostridiaceae bacterium]MDY3072080.1 ACT domain-containing protein [Eubacteriales bacterium]MDY3285771.1 ACT domain-containing protein [Eubacteriales bacterium]MDY5014503.1 ACT domain-containing protein [Eubacteriales bacterium]
MKAIITVVGRDTVGIIAKTSAVLASRGVNILDITQSVLGDVFAMVMFVDIAGCTIPFTDLVDEMDALGQEIGVKIHTMHEDIFNSMHRI